MQKWKRISVTVLLLSVFNNGCTDETSREINSGTDADTNTDNNMPANLVLPILRTQDLNGESRTVHVLEFDDGTNRTYFECTAENGGVITAFALNGKNVIAGRSQSPSAYGSTFWTSPQDWPWPPPAALYTDTYAVDYDEDEPSITLTSELIPELGVRVIKHFSVDLVQQAVVLQYTIVNETSDELSVAPWEVTRVPAGGLTFFAKGQGDAVSGSFLPLPVSDIDGVTWFSHDEAVTGQHKLFADGQGGWLAHAAQDLLFVKSFPDVPPDRQAPGEAEIELYATTVYHEVEQQGFFTPIPSGDTLDWTVTWKLQAIPDDVESSAGNAILVQLVNEMQ